MPVRSDAGGSLPASRTFLYVLVNSVPAMSFVAGFMFATGRERSPLLCLRAPRLVECLCCVWSA